MKEESIKNISLDLLNQIKNFPEVSNLIKFVQGISILILVYIIFLIIMKIIQYKRLSKIPKIYEKINSIEKKLETIESKLDKKYKSKR